MKPRESYVCNSQESIPEVRGGLTPFLVVWRGVNFFLAGTNRAGLIVCHDSGLLRCARQGRPKQAENGAVLD